MHLPKADEGKECRIWVAPDCAVHVDWRSTSPRPGGGSSHSHRKTDTIWNIATSEPYVHITRDNSPSHTER